MAPEQGSIIFMFEYTSLRVNHRKHGYLSFRPFYSRVVSNLHSAWAVAVINYKHFFISNFIQLAVVRGFA